jgi:hypothetical protein
MVETQEASAQVVVAVAQEQQAAEAVEAGMEWW